MKLSIDTTRPDPEGLNLPARKAWRRDEHYSTNSKLAVPILEYNRAINSVSLNAGYKLYSDPYAAFISCSSAFAAQA